MENIESLIKTYSGILDTLKEIQKASNDKNEFDKLRKINNELSSENKNLKENIKWNEKHIRILSHALGEKICHDCGGAGGFDDGYGSGGPCETCSSSGMIKI